MVTVCVSCECAGTRSSIAAAVVRFHPATPAAAVAPVWVEWVTGDGHGEMSLTLNKKKDVIMSVSVPKSAGLLIKWYSDCVLLSPGCFAAPASVFPPACFPAVMAAWLWRCAVYPCVCVSVSVSVCVSESFLSFFLLRFVGAASSSTRCLPSLSTGGSRKLCHRNVFTAAVGEDPETGVRAPPDGRGVSVTKESRWPRQTFTQVWKLFPGKQGALFLYWRNAARSIRSMLLKKPGQEVEKDWINQSKKNIKNK